MEIKEILNLPDYTDIKRRFTSKFKDDIIVKYKDNGDRRVYLLYKLNGEYICCFGTITKMALENEDMINDLAIEYEDSIEEFIEVRSFTITDILNFIEYSDAENKLNSKYKNDISIFYNDYLYSVGQVYRYVYYIYKFENEYIKHMSGFLKEHLNEEDFLDRHIKQHENFFVEKIDEHINGV